MSSSIGSLTQNLTVPLSEVVRARISESPVALPVRGGTYTRLNHISAVPAGPSGGGYSLWRLRAIDSMISRIANLQNDQLPDVDTNPVERQEALLEEVARLMAEGLNAGTNRSPELQGLVVDVTI